MQGIRKCPGFLQTGRVTALIKLFWIFRGNVQEPLHGSANPVLRALFVIPLARFPWYNASRFELPSLQLGLGDIARKVRNLGAGGPSAEQARDGAQDRAA